MGNRGSGGRLFACFWSALPGLVLRRRRGVRRRADPALLGLPLDPSLRTTDGTDSRLHVGSKRLAKPVVGEATADHQRDDWRDSGISCCRDRNPGCLAKPDRKAVGTDPLPDSRYDRTGPVVDGGRTDGTRRSSSVPSSYHGSFHTRKASLSRRFSLHPSTSFASRRAASIGVLAVLSNHRAPAAARTTK